jgi:hypothetical protein
LALPHTNEDEDKTGDGTDADAAVTDDDAINEG